MGIVLKTGDAGRATTDDENLMMCWVRHVPPLVSCMTILQHPTDAESSALQDGAFSSGEQDQAVG